VNSSDYGLAWPAAASLSANYHAIQQQFAAPDSPRFAALKRTLQACGSGLTTRAQPLGPRDAARIVGEEELGCHAARQSLADDTSPLRRSPGSVTSASLAVGQAGGVGVSVAHRVPPEPQPGAALDRRL
jgi:hypothetical protein